MFDNCYYCEKKLDWEVHSIKWVHVKEKTVACCEQCWNKKRSD